MSDFRARTAPSRASGEHRAAVAHTPPAPGAVQRELEHPHPRPFGDIELCHRAAPRSAIAAAASARFARFWAARLPYIRAHLEVRTRSCPAPGRRSTSAPSTTTSSRPRAASTARTYSPTESAETAPGAPPRSKAPTGHAAEQRTRGDARSADPTSTTTLSTGICSPLAHRAARGGGRERLSQGTGTARRPGHPAWRDPPRHARRPGRRAHRCR
jgi:hypothetical protein